MNTTVSKVGNKEITIPEEVKITIDGNEVKIIGPKGQMELELELGIKVEKKEKILKVSRKNDSRRLRSMHGLTRSLIANMIKGVTEGFEKGLELEGTGYRVKLDGKILEFTLGFSHPVRVEPPTGIEFEVENQTAFKVKGIDKGLVGQVAAKIRAIKPPEPYKGKGIRYKGEVVKKKPGKAAKTEAGE